MSTKQVVISVGVIALIFVAMSVGLWDNLINLIFHKKWQKDGQDDYYDNF